MTHSTSVWGKIVFREKSTMNLLMNLCRPVLKGMVVVDESNLKCLLKLISIFLSIILITWRWLIFLTHTIFLKRIAIKQKQKKTPPKNSCQLAKHKTHQSVSVNLESSFCFVVNKFHGKLKIVIFVFNLLGWFEILWNWCMWS